MNARKRQQQRCSTGQRRRKPGQGRIIHIPSDGKFQAPAESDPPPAHLTLDATDSAGHCADWLNDYLWVDLLRCWSDHALLIRYSPTPESLLNPVVVHQVAMLRRVAPAWRIVGGCYLSDLIPEGRLAQAAIAPYHEIHILDGKREEVTQTRMLPAIADVMARMREVQAAHQMTTPIIVRTAIEGPANQTGLCQPAELHDVPRPIRSHQATAL